MILRRISTALNRHDWATVFSEFVLVVAGVLIALQLDQWNRAREDRTQEILFLSTVRDDIGLDIAELDDAIQAYSAILDFGDRALAVLEEDACAEHCWPTLVALYHASQWIDVRSNRTTYDEMKRLGLPRDPSLKKTLAHYYSLSEQYARVASDLPQYRTLVRSLIPVATQDYVWAECYKNEGRRRQTMIGDCESPISEDETREIIDKFRTDNEVEKLLNFWLSTVSVVSKTLPSQIVEAESVIATLSDHIEKHE
jgi:hypothetical protein